MKTAYLGSDMRLLLLLVLSIVTVACGGGGGGGGGGDIADTTPPITSVDLSGGLFNTSQQVTLTSNEVATIYYSIDGSAPTVGGANTISGDSPISNVTMASGTTVLKFFAIDKANNIEQTKTETYIVDNIEPTVSFPTGVPSPVGLLSETTLTFQSNEDGNYVVELGGNGAQGSGEQIAAGTVVETGSINIPIAGSQLSYLAPTEVWVYVTDAQGNTGASFGELSLKPYVTITSAMQLNIFAQLLVNNAGTRLYVGNNAPLLVIDIDSGSADFNSVIATPNTGIGTNEIALTPDDSRLYATASQSNSISVIDTSSNTVIATLPSSTPEDIAITPDGTRAYIINYGSAISVMDVDAASASYHSVVASIPVSFISPLFLGGHTAITPDGAVAVINWRGLIASGVDVLDVDPTSPSYNIPVATPVPVISANANDVIVSSDSRFAYVNVGGTKGLKKIDLNDYSIAVETDNPAGGMALTPDDRWLLTGGAGGGLYILDSENLATKAVVPIDQEAINALRAIAVTPDGKSAYAVIANHDGGTVSWKLVMLPLQ